MPRPFSGAVMGVGGRNTLRKTTLRGLGSFLGILMLGIFGFVPAYGQSVSAPKTVAPVAGQSETAPKAKAPAPVAASSSTKIPIPEIAYTKFVLDNGLT